MGTSGSVRSTSRPKPGETPAVSLVPIAILPEYQNQGIGSALVRGGLEESRRLGYAIVIVLGLPDYYPLFGFSSKAAKALECPYYDAGDAWMAHELIPRALDAVRGWVVYPPAFDGALLKGDLLRTPSIEFTISTIIHAKLVRDDQKT